MPNYAEKNEVFYSDFERIDAFTEEEIERQAEEDEDIPPTDEQFWAEAVPIEDLPKLLERRRNKVPVSIRLQPQVVDFFKNAYPKGWQTAMDQVLAEYVRKAETR